MFAFEGMLFVASGTWLMQRGECWQNKLGRSEAGYLPTIR
ncbi:hypothetical protein PU02_0303 [Bartonella ancashensis]|uniref:Uncharacterized protein n=1 Tax=Bartonella ancashensis TaxID=1318743 RepID=A0A0M4M546_9HYPH|nr:hypothetical protein PU02_0303 [Bartonella ancashensis]